MILPQYILFRAMNREDSTGPHFSVEPETTEDAYFTIIKLIVESGVLGTSVSVNPNASNGENG